MASRGLDRARLVAAAAELVDRRGPEALTLAAVAAAVGVRVPSLYHHVAGLPGLRSALRGHALRLLHGTLSAATIGRAGRDAVAGLVGGIRDFAGAHPGLLAFTTHVAPDEESAAAEAAEAVVALVFAVLRGYRLEGADLVHATRVLRAAVHGFVTLEAAGGFARPEEVDDTLDVLVGVLDAGLKAFAASASRA